MRIKLVAAAVALAVVATGVGVGVSTLGDDSSVLDASNESPTSSLQPCELSSGQPAEVVSEPEIAEASEPGSDLALDLNSDSSEAVRVTIRFDGEVALDVRTPARQEGCHSPVYSHEYRLPGDEVKVTATTDQGQYRSMTVPLSGPKRWVAVMLQDGLPLKILVFDEEVSWG